MFCSTFWGVGEAPCFQNVGRLISKYIAPKNGRYFYANNLLIAKIKPPFLTASPPSQLRAQKFFFKMTQIFDAIGIQCTLLCIVK